MRLPELQRRCLERFAALNPSPDGLQLESLVESGATHKSTGLAVYANNYSEIVVGTLRNVFPTIEQLVGDACFRSLARSYSASFTSHSGDLQSFGRAFPELLDQIYADTEHAFLSDVARLEFAVDECLTKQSIDGISGEQLQTALGEDESAIHLDVNPSFDLVRSQFPILDIWKAHADATLEQLSLDSEAQNVVIVRLNDHARLTAVSDIGAELIELIAQGNNMDDALDATGVIDANQLMQALRDIVNSGAFIGIRSE